MFQQTALGDQQTVLPQAALGRVLGQMYVPVVLGAVGAKMFPYG
jgi:hypothetical protein